MKPEAPIIRTARVLMRPFLPTDIGNVFKGLSDPEVVKYYGIRFDTLEATREQMNWFVELETSGRGVWWAVCSPDNRIFYGAGGLNDRDRVQEKAEIGFWLLKDFWRQGILTEVLPVICEYGFKTLRLRRIECFVDAEHVHCKKAIEKLGFQYESTMKACECIDGRAISIESYAILQ